MPRVPFEGKNRGPEAYFECKGPIFFGKIMVPESTFGKLILPFRAQFMNFGDELGVISGKLMLPGVAILWVK